MTLRTALWLAGVAWLAWGSLGCEPINAHECTTDQKCNSYERCDVAIGACVLRACSIDDECGMDGQCDGGSGTYCVPSGPCNPVCAGYQICSHGSCAGRYKAVHLIEPLDKTTVGKAGTTVRASLEANPNVARNDPVTLQLSIMFDGGTSTQQLAGDGGGVYSTAWIPTVEQAYQLRVAYPAAGLQSPTIDVLTDLTSPHLTIVVPPPNRRPYDGGWAHDGDDLSSMNAWRRDESVTLRLTADEELDPTSVKLSLSGIGVGATVTDVQLSSCTGGNDCFEGIVDLSQPVMQAGRGTMALSATANDLVGNSGIASGGIEVTRVRWYFTAPEPMKATPAVGPGGTVYAGSTNGGNGGSLWAIEPNGKVRWTAGLGAVEGSPAVGLGVDGGVETVYAAFNASPNTILAAFDSMGAKVYSCEVYTGPVYVSLGVGNTRYLEAAPAESAFAVVNESGSGGALVAVRPGGGSAWKCLELPGLGYGAFPAGVGVIGTKVFFGDNNGSVQGYEFDGGWKPLGNWPVSVGTLVKSIALSPSGVLGTAGGLNQGGAFSIPLDGGTLDWKYPSTFPTGDEAYPAAWSNGGLLYATGRAISTKSLVRVQPQAATAESATLGSLGQTAPVVAADGTLYVAEDGRLEIFHSDLSQGWTLTLTGAVVASPNMDCRRDVNGARQHGLATLYVATMARQLYSIITDSNGIDTTAPWPRYQHDPRNTGNADVPLSEFACP